jgi:two-component system, sensor histidine kinase LadS
VARLTLLLGLLLAALWALAPEARAQAPTGEAVVLRGTDAPLDLSGALAVLEDPTGRWTLADVSSPGLASRFRPWPAARGDLNLGFTASAVWIRVSLRRAPEAEPRWLIEIPYQSLDQIEFHAPGLAPVITGSGHPLSSRPVYHRFYVFPIEPGTETADHYFKVTSSYALTVPVTAWPRQAFEKHTQHTYVVHAAYQGALLALALYNLLVFLALGDRRFALYAGYATAFGLAMFSGNGFAGLFFWPGLPGFNAVAQGFWLSLAAASSLMFSREFLQLQKSQPRLHTAMQWMEAAFAATAASLVASVWMPALQQPAHLVTMACALAACAAVLAAGVLALRQGQRSARLFMAAWGLLWLGGLVAATRAMGWLPTNVITAHALQIASSVEMLLLALALADTIRIERQTREEAQARALRAQAEVLEALETSEKKLESAVQQRTEELHAALAREQRALASQLRMAALVSHEIRNPLSIIDGQVTLIRKERQRGLDTLERRLSVVTRATGRLFGLVERWLEGDRLRTSIESQQRSVIPLDAWLREFVDAQAEFNADHPIEFVLEYEGPADIEADEHLLEVAVSNLVANACGYSAKGTPVSVHLRRHAGRIGIAVVDRGRGIAAADQGKVFEAYFRAHPEDQPRGMGLGLNFVRRIARAHDWAIELHSTVGQGSSFCLWMPCPATAPAAAAPPAPTPA